MAVKADVSLLFSFSLLLAASFSPAIRLSASQYVSFVFSQEAAARAMAALCFLSNFLSEGSHVWVGVYVRMVNFIKTKVRTSESSTSGRMLPDLNSGETEAKPQERVMELRKRRRRALGLRFSPAAVITALVSQMFGSTNQCLSAVWFVEFRLALNYTLASVCVCLRLRAGHAV